MRDRLQELKLKAKKLQIDGENNSATVQEEEQEKFEQQAIIYEKEPTTERHLHEIQKLQNEINNLVEEVHKFSQQQKSLISSIGRFSILKKESNITREIKIQAEHIQNCLDDLSKTAKKAENEHGPSCATVRILASQHAFLSLRYLNAMLSYNDAIAAKQEKCRMFITHQLEVAGKELSEEENHMLQQGKWEIFNENLLTEVKITKAQLSEIEQRHKELVNLENQMKDLQELFIQISVLAEEQGEMINNIEICMNSTQEYIQASNETFELAVKYQKRNPCKAICCWCCPCCK
ncbi:LOW QUALITY PROTEIN: syntaxin-19 [Indicator indicator]|uniref:LOW QUALITY PROTEIN: syntaxin-19 n=1 Tax=Indicator indicator TaxID=1002788 RepID=UPI0023DEDB9C|nr:LOW QUALITY PROTEIN: syntaxin-19 [Indicator indicator]